MQVIFIQGAGEGAYEWDQPLVQLLQQQLQADISFHYPPMPQEEAPNYQLWKTAILQELEASEAPLVLIGHSLGGSVLLKLLSEEKMQKKIKALFLVSVPFWGEAEWQSPEFMLKADFERCLPAIDTVFIYHAEDDEVVDFAHHLRYAASLPRAVVRTFPQGGHEMVAAAQRMSEDIHQLR